MARFLSRWACRCSTEGGWFPHTPLLKQCPVDLLDQWTTRSDSARSGGAGLPLVTYYDVGTGERTELSGTTMRNWVAKASSLLVDELDAEPGTRLWIGLPTHWQRCVWLLAAWNVGALLVDSGADIVVTGPDLDLGSSTGAPHRLASALLPFGVPFSAAPAGFVDLGTALPGQPDAFVPYVRPTDSDPATEFGQQVLTRAALKAASVPSSERLLLTPGPVSRDLDAIVAALLGGGSIVLVNGGSTDDLDRLAHQERARIA
jgi:uncharacterized protein (TIGR03089 family)